MAGCVPSSCCGDLSADELHAVATARELACEAGLIAPQMHHKHPTITLVRCEARIAVRKVRGQGLGPHQLEQVAMSAVQALIDRKHTKESKRCAT